MKKKDTIEITISPMVEIAVVGPSSKKREMEMRLIDLKNSAQKYGGVVAHELDSEDGFRIAIKFSDEDLMEVWKNLIKTTN